MARSLRLFAVLVVLVALPAEAQQRVAPAARSGQVPAPALARAAAPEGATVRIVEETPGSVTVEVMARWDKALADAPAPTSADALAAALVGSEATATALIELGARVPPQVEVLEADAEDIQLSGASRVAEAFAGPLAEVVGVGERRRQIVGSLRVRMLRVEGDRVTRYRRVLVRVNRTAPDGAARCSKPLAAGARTSP